MIISPKTNSKIAKLEIRVPLLRKFAMEVDVEETQSFVGKFGRKRSKNVLSLSDTLISIFLVTPLVVAFWRGTWELMAIYDAFLPHQDLYVLGVTVHFVLAICRERLEELMGKFKTAELVLRRCYSYLFAWSCISFWLPNFILFDYVCSVEALSNSSSAQRGLFCFFVVFIIIITLTLFLLRSFRNVLSAPFTIVMDRKRSTYYFPTRFKKRILCATLYVVDTVQNANVTVPVANSNTLKRRQVTVEKQLIETLPARPFMNELRGAHPSGFSSSFVTTTVPNYPSNHRNPHSIHDIIEYITDNAHKQKQLLYRQQQQFNRNNYFPQDPFFAFKPQDPSDINLLAPNSFRFAPVIVNNGVQKNRLGTKEAESVVYNSSVVKPLKLSLNIYPTPYLNTLENEETNSQGPGITPRYKYPYVAQWTRSGHVPGRMVVHLNVYPGVNHLNQDLPQHQQAYH